MKKLTAFAASAALLCGPIPVLAQESDGMSEMEVMEAGHCLMSGREVVERFIQMFYVERNVREAFETFVHPDYIQHNPFAATGRQPAIDFLAPAFAANPEATSTVHRIIGEGNMFAVHVHNQSGPDDPGQAVIDLLRVEDCLIVEHWDVIQQVPEQSMNENTMF